MDITVKASDSYSLHNTYLSFMIKEGLTTGQSIPREKMESLLDLSSKGFYPRLYSGVLDIIRGPNHVSCRVSSDYLDVIRVSIYTITGGCESEDLCEFSSYKQITIDMLSDTIVFKIDDIATLTITEIGPYHKAILINDLRNTSVAVINAGRAFAAEGYPNATFTIKRSEGDSGPRIEFNQQVH